MKIAPVRRYSLKGVATKMATVDLDSPDVVVVLARRDLIFLQRLFRKLRRQQRVRPEEFDAFQRRVTALLTELTSATCKRGPT